MAYTYTRTINVVPSGSSYTWTNPASSWITISQVGTSDTWEIEIADNSVSSSRSAVLTITHEDGVTTDTINVAQAGSNGVNNPTPIPPTPTPETTPTPTPTATPTPTPSQWTFSMTSNDTSGSALDLYNTDIGSPAQATYQIIGPANTTPVAPSVTTSLGWAAFSVEPPTFDSTSMETGQSTYTGVINCWESTTPSEDISATPVNVEWSNSETDTFYVKWINMVIK